MGLRLTPYDVIFFFFFYIHAFCGYACLKNTHNSTMYWITHISYAGADPEY